MNDKLHEPVRCDRCTVGGISQVHLFAVVIVLKVTHKVQLQAALYFGTCNS